ncbi:hypothetical protein KDW_10070 [Dictyobacter vulcani]|uniref:N-acetyltransferase domain-containing protein n=1 Tax=Dictyobacter vulcani TaxID=2607529 RepID=A0A5J4KH04_9CHLR|nr:GNAT family N-acetyltransferase [Dictyobacter vulcani]GER86845.1 hypothetical protein KDW_10070 [Dictyobacter vulcani]
MQTTADSSYRRELGNGLVLRWSTEADIGRIAALHSIVHRNHADDPPNPNAIKVINRMMNNDYPLMGPNDFAIIEDTSRDGNPVVACTCMWKQTWTYEGIPFSIGRPEMVATDPAYRNRGLIRSLFEMFHARSEAEGDLVQAITGIAYFYRQFGYEYALELIDQRTTPVALIPKIPEGVAESFTLRPATRDDIPELEALYKRRADSGIVTERVSYKQWLYEVETWKDHPELGHALHVQIIIDATAQMIGFLATDVRRSNNKLNVWLLEFVDGVNMQAAMPAVLRALQTYSLNMELARADTPVLSEISFNLGTTHPVHEVLGKELDRETEPPYAWYIRVKDLPAFLRHIAPALEKRLAASPLAGYSGEIKIDFYRDGLRMVFEQGRITIIESWRAPLYAADANASFPPLLFLQVLFGHRSIEALRYIFPDIWVSNEARLLLKILFPTRPSFVPGWN